MTDKKKNPEIEEADFITLEFEDGVEVECEIMGVFDYDGKEYIAPVSYTHLDVYKRQALCHYSSFNKKRISKSRLDSDIFLPSDVYGYCLVT